MADTVPNGGVIVDGQVWTAAQWNNAWTVKVDATNGTSSGQILNNPIITGATYTGNNLSTSDATASGTISLRTLADHFSDVVYAKDFGAVFDGNSHPLSSYFATLAAAQAVYPNAVALTDEIDGVAIQAAINFCQSRVVNFSYGGTIIVPPGKGLMNQPLTIAAQCVSLQSQGYGFFMNSNVQRTKSSTPTRLTWTGAAVSAGSSQNRMLTVAPTLAGARLLTGTNVRGILFDCNAIAGTSGIFIASVRNSIIDAATYEAAGVAYVNASLTANSQVVAVTSTAGLRLGESVVSPSLPDGCYVASIINSTTFNASAQATATNTETVTIGGEGIRFDVVDALSDSNDTQDLHVRFFGSNLQGAANATGPLVLIGGSGVTGASGGTHFGNTSLVWFDRLAGVYNNGHGVVCNNSDHNFHEDISCQKIGAGAGKLLVCNGSLDPNNGGARFHLFRHVGGDSYFKGTDTGGFTSASVGSTILFLDAQNGAPAPVVGVGASVSVSADNQKTVGINGGTNPVQAQYTDHGIGGGNSRGSNAVDLQAVRTDATHVASGSLSAIVGGSDAIADLYGVQSYASGGIATSRVAQACTQILRTVSAANTTPVRLTADGGAASNTNCVNLTAAGTNQVNNLHVQLTAIDSTNNSNFYIWTQPIGLLSRNGLASTTTYTAGTPVTLTGGTTTGIAVTEAADTTHAGYSLQFTPPTGNTAIWRICATVRWTRIDGG